MVRVLLEASNLELMTWKPSLVYADISYPSDSKLSMDSLEYKGGSVYSDTMYQDGTCKEIIPFSGNSVYGLKLIVRIALVTASFCEELSSETADSLNMSC